MKAKWLKVLLVAIPLTIVAWYLNRVGANRGHLTVWIFALALISVIPLAALIGRVTGTLSTYLGDRVGGLLGASFGNAPELAIGIFLLVHAGMHVNSQLVLHSDFDVIRGLLIGSVINNVLFVLGSSIFFAGLRNGRMGFSADSAAGYASMLALAVVGLALPTLATSLSSEANAQSVNSVSLAFGAILIISYIAYLAASVFGLGNHPHRSKRAKRERERREPDAKGETVPTTDGIPMLVDDPAHKTELEKRLSTEQDPDAISRAKRAELRRQNPHAVWIALGVLAVLTGATVLIAGILVSVTDNVIQNTPLTPLSTGLILFPIVCNLGEQAGSVLTAWENRMEGAMSLAAGSSVQVALFVTPVLVLISFMLAGGNDALILKLIFQPMELILLGLVSFVYALVSLDGETTWLEGLQLLAFYAMIVAVAFVLPGR